MKRFSIRLIIAVFVAGIAAITQVSCNESTLIDARVAPNLNNISDTSIDTFTIISTTIYDTDVNTSYTITGLPIYHAIGTINKDDFFGKTNAGVFMQIVPASTSPGIFSPSSNNIVDSAVLILPYSGFTYGDPSSSAPNQSIGVYRMIDTLFKDSTYYASTEKRYDTALYGSTSLNMSMVTGTDSVFYFGANRKRFLRIKLNNKFLADLGELCNDHSIDYPTFLNYFRGIYIGPTDTNQNGQSLPYFQLDGTDTFSQANVLVFYHTTTNDTAQVFQFPFNGNYCGHYNHITRNYTSTTASTYIKAYNNRTSDDIILVQNQPGAALNIIIPFLKNLSTQIPKMIINKAELIITQVNNPSPVAIFPPPPKLYATGVISLIGRDSIYDIADRYPNTSTSPLVFLGGYWQPATVSGNATTQYIINMPREVINTINQQRELHLHINGTRDYFGAFRLIAGGSNFPDKNYRVKLRIVYSKQK